MPHETTCSPFWHEVQLSASLPHPKMLLSSDSVSSDLTNVVGNSCQSRTTRSTSGQHSSYPLHFSSRSLSKWLPQQRSTVLSSELLIHLHFLHLYHCWRKVNWYGPWKAPCHRSQQSLFDSYLQTSIMKPLKIYSNRDVKTAEWINNC